MRKSVYLLLLLLISWQSYGKGIISFKISKPVCLLTFLLTARGNPDMSPSFRAYIYNNIPREDSTHFFQIVKEFSTIPLDYDYIIPDYPENRKWPRTTFNLISVAAVQAIDVNDFMQRIIGILPNEQWVKLKQVFANTEPLYDKMIGVPYAQATKKQLAALEKFNGKTDSIFNELRSFYSSSWSDDIPVTVSIYPIPGTKDNTTATPHSNSIVLAVMTGEKNSAMSVSKAIHEMCHVLYGEQGLSVQQRLDSAFLQNKSIYSKYAYGYIDEALATACGNGWAYKKLSGEQSAGSWYANEYINGYGHAIYPLVAAYIEKGKALDKAFVDSAIFLFEKKFPKAIYSYLNLLNKVTIYTDANDHEQFLSIISSVKHHFQMHRFYGTYPISDPQSANLIDQSDETQLIIVHSNHEQNFKLLKNKFPQLKNTPVEKDGVYSFFDDKKRPVIIVNVKDVAMLDAALSMMAKTKEMDPDRIFTPLN